MAGSPEDIHNNSLSNSGQKAPMPRDYSPTPGGKVIRRLDGHSGGTGIGLAAANIQDPDAPKEDNDPTFDYGYYGEQDRL